MNVYQGTNRRQVGGGIWSTIQRGIKPMLESIYSKLKPHAATVAKKAAKSALNMGGTMAMDALSGNLNKKRAKRLVKDEAIKHLAGIKRKYLDEDQEGYGHYKRRKISKPKSKARKMPRRTKKHGRKPKRSRRKVKRSTKSKAVKRGRIAKKIYKRKRRSASKKSFKDIFNTK